MAGFRMRKMHGNVKWVAGYRFRTNTCGEAELIEPIPVGGTGARYTVRFIDTGSVVTTSDSQLAKKRIQDPALPRYSKPRLTEEERLLQETNKAFK